MVIRAATEEDFTQIAGLYTNFFKTHNIFQREKDIVIAHIRKEALERDSFIVYEEDGLVKGSVILVRMGSNHDGSHKRWKFRHFAFESEKIAEKLLGEAEKRIRENSKTAKVELTIAENEEGIDFYKKWGYKQEGVLEDHYRWEESCFVLGKSFS